MKFAINTPSELNSHIQSTLNRMRLHLCMNFIKIMFFVYNKTN